MPNVEHGLLTPHQGSGIHAAIGWPPFASDADRLAKPLVPTDVGKIALVEDTGRTWMLVRYSPPRWVEWIDGGVLDQALDGKADDSDIASLQAQINMKADAAATQAALAQKADLTYVNTELNLKADQTDLVTLETTVNLKADLTYVDSQLAMKADQSALDALAANVASDAELAALAAEVALKADQADLDAKADASAVSAALATKANQADLDALALELDAKADLDWVTQQLALKADTAYVDLRLDEKADLSYVNGKADQTYVDAQLGLKADTSYVNTELGAVDARLDALETAAGVDISDKVTGPASATSDALVRYDGVTGKLVKDSPALLTDAGDLSIAGSLVTGGTVDGVDLGTLETIVGVHDAELLTVVHGPAGATDHAIPRYDGETGLLLDNPPGGPTIDDAGNILLTTGATVDGYDVSVLGGQVQTALDALGEKVTGPGVSTQDALPRFADATGKLIKDSLVRVDDAGKLSAPSLDVATDIAVGGLVDGVDVAAMKATVDQNTVAISELCTQTYVTLTPSGALDNERVLTEGLGTQVVDGGPGGPLSVGQRAGYKEVSGAIYTLQLADAFQEIAVTTDNATVVVPDNATAPFPMYTRLWVTPKVSDRFMPVYFEADPGVALVTPPGVSDPGGDGATVCLFKIGTDRWHLSGEFDDKTTYLTLDWTGARSNSRILEAGDNVTFEVEDAPNGKVRINATVPGGGGDVTGPASSGDNAVARYDATTGKVIQDSLVTIDDSGNIATPGTVDGVDVSALSSTVADKVTGPALSVDNTIPRYDQTTGKVLQTSGVTIDDSNNLSGIAGLTATSATINGNIAVTGTVDGVDVSALSTTVSGKMTGPASSTLNTLVKYGDTTGKLAKISGVTLDDSNNLSGLAGVSCTSATVSGSITVSGTVDGVDVSNLNTTVTGKMTGAASSTLNTLVKYGDTTGKLAKISGATLDDSNNLTGIASATCTSLTVNGSITVSGTVDGVDVSALSSTVSTLNTNVSTLTSRPYITFGADATLTAERALAMGDSMALVDEGSAARVHFRPQSILVQSGPLTLNPAVHLNGSLINIWWPAADVAFTLAADATYNFPNGTILRLARVGGTPRASLAPAGGVELFVNSAATSWSGYLYLYHVNFVTLHKVYNNSWIAQGICSQ